MGVPATCPVESHMTIPEIHSRSLFPLFFEQWRRHLLLCHNNFTVHQSQVSLFSFWPLSYFVCSLSNMCIFCLLKHICIFFTILLMYMLNVSVYVYELIFFPSVYLVLFSQSYTVVNIGSWRLKTLSGIKVTPIQNSLTNNNQMNIKHKQF